MGRVEEYFRKPRRKLSIEEIDDMLYLLDKVYDAAITKKEHYYIQIALIHLLVGYLLVNLVWRCLDFARHDSGMPDTTEGCPT